MDDEARQDMMEGECPILGCSREKEYSRDDEETGISKGGLKGSKYIDETTVGELIKFQLDPPRSP